MSNRFKHKWNLFLVGVFWVSLCGLLFYNILTGYRHLLLCPPLEMNALLGRVPYRFIWPSKENVTSGEFQRHIDLVLRDNFPNGARIISSMMTMKYMISQQVLGGFSEKSSSFIPLGSTRYVLRNFNQLVEKPHLLTPQRVRSTQQKAQYYNQLAQQYSGVNVYVCYAMSPQDIFIAKTRPAGDEASGVFAGGQYVQIFRNSLDARVTLIVPGESSPLQDALNLYYRSDHHWRIQGAYQVYRELIETMSEKAPSIGRVALRGGWQTEKGITFFGSHARMCGGYDGISDSIENTEYQIEGVVRTDGEPPTELGSEIAASVISDDKYYNYYLHYYGQDFGLISYETNLKNKRGLLVIGDSMDNSITKLMASNYEHSYFVDMNDYEEERGEAFSITNFINDHAITDVLFIGRDWVIQG